MSETEARLLKLEERVAWLERYTQELDSVLRPLADQLHAMRREIQELRDQHRGEEQTEGGYEVPPHY